MRDGIPPAFAAILARFAKLHPAVLSRDQRLQADLGIDSLSMIDVACAAEDEFGIRVPDEELERFGTVGDAVDFIERAGHAG